MRECSQKSVPAKREVAKPEVKTSFFLVLYRISFLRSFVKWIMRKLTGSCELQRIVRKYKFAERNNEIQQSLLLSKNDILRDAVSVTRDLEEIPKLVSKIMLLKDIIPEADPPFEEALTTTLFQINGYNVLFEEVETMRKEGYNCENESHEEMLMKFWKLLKPDQKLEQRVCKDWCELGFQGADPKTDFRGMGILGLKCMVYFAERHNDKARQLLQHSLHPTLGYSYAIVSINITSLMYEMLQSGCLRTQFYNEVKGKPTVEDFMHAFSCAFFQFDRFWLESKPENVMAFNQIRENFALDMAVHLSPPNFGSLTMTEL